MSLADVEFQSLTNVPPARPLLPITFGPPPGLTDPFMRSHAGLIWWYVSPFLDDGVFAISAAAFYPSWRSVLRPIVLMFGGRAGYAGLAAENLARAYRPENVL